MRAALIDASGYIYRHHYATPLESIITRSDGVQVHAIKGYCDVLDRIARFGGYSHVGVILDGGRSGRTAIDPNYKATRKERPPELTAQLGMVADATAAYGITSVKAPGMEADDVIATYARQISAAGGEATIFSMDKDLIPLICEPGITVYDPVKKQDVTPDVVMQRFGVHPDQMMCFLSLVGDSADNIPGVPSIGEKAAAQLLRAHDHLDAIIDLAQRSPESLSCKPAQRTKLIENIDAARLSRDLVMLISVPDLPDMETLAFTGMDPDRMVAYLRAMEFNVMAHEMCQTHGIAA